MERGTRVACTMLFNSDADCATTCEFDTFQFQFLSNHRFTSHRRYEKLSSSTRALKFSSIKTQQSEMLASESRWTRKHCEHRKMLCRIVCNVTRNFIFVIDESSTLSLHKFFFFINSIIRNKLLAIASFSKTNPQGRFLTVLLEMLRQRRDCGVSTNHEGSQRATFRNPECKLNNLSADIRAIASCFYEDSRGLRRRLRIQRRQNRSIYAFHLHLIFRSCTSSVISQRHLRIPPTLSSRGAHDG